MASLPWRGGGGRSPEAGWLREKRSTDASRFRFDSGALRPPHLLYNGNASHAVAGASPLRHTKPAVRRASSLRGPRPTTPSRASAAPATSRAQPRCRPRSVAGNPTRRLPRDRRGRTAPTGAPPTTCSSRRESRRPSSPWSRSYTEIGSQPVAGACPLHHTKPAVRRASYGEAGMGSSLGVRVPRGGDDPNHKPEATASP